MQPAAQGLGLGSALLRATLVGVDAAGEPAYLEATSPDNRRLYERHGFQVVRELPLPGGPSLFAMWREPQTGGGRDHPPAAAPLARRSLRDRRA